MRGEVWPVSADTIQNDKNRKVEKRSFLSAQEVTLLLAAAKKLTLLDTRPRSYSSDLQAWTARFRSRLSTVEPD